MAEDVTEIGILRGTEVVDDSETAATVRLIGDDGTATVQLTDRSAVEFVGTAERLFDDVHEDVVEREDRFNVHPDDVDDRGERRSRRDR